MVSYHHFTLTMDRSPGFGSIARNSFALFRLGFPSAPQLNCLTSLHTITRRSVLQKVRGRTLHVLSLLVNTGFQVLFHSPPGVLFTFPSRYYSLSVIIEYLALGGGPPCFPPDFSCPAVLWISTFLLMFSLTGLLPSLVLLSRSVLLTLFRITSGPQPRLTVVNRFGLFPFRSPLLRKSIISFSSSGYLDVSVHRVPSHQPM